MATTKRDYKQIAKEQCERVAEIYYHFRKKGGTANDLIEVPAMKRLMGDVGGKKILDAGCGFGYYSIYCARQGADVTGIDISETMIALAKKEADEAGVQIEFMIQNITEMTAFTDDTFDMVISSLASSFGVSEFFKEAGRVLKPGGVFCFSEVHPIIDGGHREGDGSDACYVVDRYFDGSIRKMKNVFGKIHPDDPDYEWLWEPHTIEDYITAMRDAGLLVESIIEPKPDPEMENANPQRFERNNKYPVFLLIRAIKISL